MLMINNGWNAKSLNPLLALTQKNLIASIQILYKNIDSGYYQTQLFTSEPVLMI